MAKKKKAMFHKPERTGEVKPIPGSVPMTIVSIGSLVLLVALTVFAVFVATKHSDEKVILGGNFTISAGVLFLFLPIVCWIIALCARLSLRLIPLEMWRLPQRVKTATVKTEGKYLKWTTLLLELETVLCFGYITLRLFGGHEPGNVIIILWVALVAATIIFFGRYALIKTFGVE